MLGGDAAADHLLGRLFRERRDPLAVLRVAPGAWAAVGGAHVLAVTAGRLWLAQPRLVGGPDVASVPLAEVGDVTVDAGVRGGPGLAIEVGGHRLRYRALEDATACTAFVAAVRAGREG